MSPGFDAGGQRPVGYPVGEGVKGAIAHRRPSSRMKAGREACLSTLRSSMSGVRSSEIRRNRLERLQKPDQLAGVEKPPASARLKNPMKQASRTVLYR